MIGTASAAPVERTGDVLTWLATIDGHELRDSEQVDLITALEALKCAAAAAQARVTEAFSVARETAGEEARSIGSQVAFARRESPSRGDRYVGLAKALVRELPETMGALTQGVLSEWRATLVCRETATLSPEHRREADRRLAPFLGALGDRALAAAARRIAAELDAAGVVARMARAVGSRRVSVRPAPDGMAYLTVLGPLVEVVGAHAALNRYAGGVAAGVCADESPDGRTRAQVAADAALRLLSRRQIGEQQPVEVQLVMTDRSLLTRSDEPARLGGHSVLPGTAARAALRDPKARVWLRRLYTTPDGRDLVAMDSRRRCFTGSLRRLLILRDQTCRTPWCDAPISDLDHVTPARSGGVTRVTNGAGLCRRCNQVKELPGWRVEVVRDGPHRTLMTTPTRHRHGATAPPLLGWGWTPRRTGSEVEHHLATRLTDAA